LLLIFLEEKKPLADPEIKFLCFDEFQVTDIADASILKKLFTILFDQGTIIFSTSNIKPSNLYLEGLHRDRFVPFIDYIENDCLVINIDSGKDYRKNRIIDAEIYYSPLNDLTEEAMDKIFNNITNGSPYEEKILFVKGREIRVERQALGCARFDFEELCVKPLGAEDYLAISKEFDIIFIDGLHTYEQTFSDICNSISLSSPESFFLIDDTLPSDIYSSFRSQKLRYESRVMHFK